MTEPIVLTDDDIDALVDYARRLRTENSQQHATTATIVESDYIRYAKHQIGIGRRASMPGVIRCQDCGEPFANDHTGIRWCPGCRPNHDRICGECGTRFDGDADGTRRCKACRNQIALF